MRIVMLLVLCAELTLVLSGCAVKKIKAWPPEIEFSDGFDISVGTNAIDSVDDRRGMSRKHVAPTN